MLEFERTDVNRVCRASGWYTLCFHVCKDESEEAWQGQGSVVHLVKDIPLPNMCYVLQVLIFRRVQHILLLTNFAT